jgi:hypothetical protein
VVARQQVKGDAGSGLHGFERADDDLALDLVGLEHVAAHHDEGAALRHGQGPDAGDRLNAGRRKAGLGLIGQKVPGHAELPVRRVKEFGHGRTVNRRCDIWTQF